MSDAVQEPLLGEFGPSSYEQWREAAEDLLKGAPFDKVMRTKTPEGIVLEPIYRAEDCAGLAQEEALPGQGDYLRGTRPQGYLEVGWKIAQELGAESPAEFNKALLGALRNGQNAVRVRLDAATRLGLDPDEASEEQVGGDGLSLASLSDFRKAFDGVSMDAIPVFFECGASVMAIRSLLLASLGERAVGEKRIQGGFNADPLGALAMTGALPLSLEDALDEASVAARLNSEEMPELATLAASGWPYHCAGASSTEELGCALASGVFYLRELVARGLVIDVAAKQIQFDLSIGPDFFMEIAKLRAARQVWSRVVRSLGGSDAAAKLKLQARTGVFNKTKCDPYVNMLRCTTEAFSAVVGGADSITVGRFDEVLRPANEFSSRIARNVQLILQEECDLTTVVDPAGGAWYVERLTEQVARESWKLFQEIEKRGGQYAALKSGYVQELVGKTRKAKETMLGQRRIKLVGTNQYPNLQEAPLAPNESSAEARASRIAAVVAERVSGLEVPSIDLKEADAAKTLVDFAKRGATLGQLSQAILRKGAPSADCDPLPNTRLAILYEEMRDASAAYQAANGHGPQLFLANIGPLKRHKLRADFTRSFFEAGGFGVINPGGFSDDASASEAFQKSGARLAVICGTDPDYLERAPGLAKALKAANPGAKVILAGFPGENEASFREAGMDDYIFVKSDNYQTNRKYLVELGAL